MKTYSHSGWAPPHGVFATLFAGMAAAVPFGFIYAYSFRYIPYPYLNIVITLAFGAGLGFIVAKTAEWGKVRNNIIVGAIGLFVGLFGLYVYWGAYWWAVAGFDRVAQIGLYAFMPWGILDLALRLFDKGSWGISENAGNLTGWLLVGIWVIETCIVLGLSVVVSLLNSDRPFCETCQVWTEPQRGVARLSGNGSEPAWEKVLAGELPALAEFPPAPPGAMQYVRLDLARCPRCEYGRFLTICAVDVVVDKEGKASEKARALVTNGIVTPSQCAVVEACGKLYDQHLEQSLGPLSAEAGGPPAPAEGES